MAKIIRFPPKDKGLGEPLMKFEDTFSAEVVLLKAFFPNVVVETEGYKLKHYEKGD